MHRLWVLLIGLIMLVSTGCAGEKPPQVIPTAAESKVSSSSSSTSASPATSAATVQVPVMPEAAKRSDDAGQKAFIEHWMALYNYARQTGDTEPFMAISERNKSNLGLQARIRTRFAGDPLRVEGNIYRIVDMVRVPLDDQSQTRPTLTLVLTEGRIVGRDGSVEKLDEAEKQDYWALLTFGGDGWRFGGFHHV